MAFATDTGVGHVLLFAALGLQGLAAGAENANEMGYWQTLTPDELLGRVNAARRSVNRTMAALGAVIAGLLVGAIGERLTLLGVVVVFAIAAATLGFSPIRYPAREL